MKTPRVCLLLCPLIALATACQMAMPTSDAGPGLDAGGSVVDAGGGSGGGVGGGAVGGGSGGGVGGCEQDLAGAFDWNPVVCQGDPAHPELNFTLERASCVTQTGCSALVTTVSAPDDHHDTFPATASGRDISAEFDLGVALVSCVIHVNTSGLASLVCKSGSTTVCATTGRRVSTPGATSYCCQPGPAASCGSGQRCQAFGTTTSTTLFTACVPAGPTPEGGSCVRENGLVGADTCGTNLFCANFGQPTGARVCQRLCSSPDQCHSDEVCQSLRPSTPAVGVCRPRCAATVGPCSTGTSCVPAQDIFTTMGTAGFAGACAPFGTNPLGGTGCATNACEANTFCVGTPSSPASCRAVCDHAHPCDAGQCTVFGVPVTDAGMVGFCE